MERLRRMRSMRLIAVAHPKVLACMAIGALISVLPTPAQTSASDSTAIPGVVEPLELRGEAQGIVQPSELQKRLADAFPKSNDPEESKRAKEAVNQIIQQYPNSIEARSTRLVLSSDPKPPHGTITPA